MTEDTTVPDLYRLAFMPGCFRCPKCGFILTKACINPNLDVIGTREQDRTSEPCPNDGTMMAHVTYREQLEEYAARLKDEFERIEQLKAALGWIFKQAKAEVDRPGDNESRFRMLIRIRDIAERAENG